MYNLEESSRELKTELKIQKKKAKDMEELRDSLTKQLLLYRQDLFIYSAPYFYKPYIGNNSLYITLIKTFFLQGCH